MNIINQLKTAITAYQGPITGDSIEAAWFRQAVRQLLALEAASC
jgi:hypothetical protein